MTAAHLADIGEADRVAGLTLAVTVLDETLAGFAAAAMSDRAAQAAIRVSAKKGFLDGRDMAEMFAWLRPTDLVWRYVVNNYVQGRKPAAFDVLFWNADTTRMAAALHRDMVLMGLRNSLVTPGEVNMLGSRVDLAKISSDAYVIGGVADHISPWQATYRSARLLGSKDNRYVLSTSRHIAALVNPPDNPKASFRTGPVDAEDPQQWLDSAQKFADSWWPDYVGWLAERSGPEVDAPENAWRGWLPAAGPGARQLCDGEVSMRSTRVTSAPASTIGEERYVTAGGQRIRVNVHRGTGVPLVLCNGIGATFEVLDPLVEQLGCTVVRFDVPGTGGSPHPCCRMGSPTLPGCWAECCPSWASAWWMCWGCPGVGPSRSSSHSRIRVAAGDWCWSRRGPVR